LLRFAQADHKKCPEGSQRTYIRGNYECTEIITPEKPCVEMDEKCDGVTEIKCHRIPRSCDPNEMAGPRGYGDPDTERYVTPGEVLHYIIHFENKAEADASAQEIHIVNQLSDALDWSTFRLGEVMFSNQTVTDLDGLTSGVFEVPQDNSKFHVRVQGGIKLTTGEATWYLRCVDPSTADGWPEDPDTGMLPPNNPGTHVGEGYVTYSVRVRSDASSNVIYSGAGEAGTIPNTAEIVFDYNAPIVTDPAWWNRIADTAPEAPANHGIEDGGHISVLRPMLAWGKSGLAQTYNVYLWLDGVSEPTSPLVAGITSTFLYMPFDLVDGATYRWRIDAVNPNGTTTGYTWTFTTGVQLPEGEGEGESEGESVGEGEGESVGEGEGESVGEGEGEGEGENGGCCSSGCDSNKTRKDWLGDWLLLGLSVLMLVGLAKSQIHMKR